MRPWIAVGLTLCFISGVSEPERCWAGIAAPQSVIDAIAAEIPSSASNAFVGAFGLTMDDRPYEPATPLGTAAGFDFGIEVSLPMVPSAMIDQAFSGLSALGLGGLSSSMFSSLPVLPVVKFSIHKGLGPLDIGLELLPSLGALSSKLPSSVGTLLGMFAFTDGDVKYVFFDPSEGPTVAARLCFSATWVNLPSNPTFDVFAMTWQPQVIVSRKMSFADPYVGAGFEFATGSISTTVTQAPFDPFTVTKGGSNYAGLVFGGLSLTIPHAGIRLTIEGGYSSVGADYLGTKLGVTF